jgi:hypothetical protein
MAIHSGSAKEIGDTSQSNGAAMRNLIEALCHSKHCCKASFQRLETDFLGGIRFVFGDHARGLEADILNGHIRHQARGMNRVFSRFAFSPVRPGEARI